MGGEVEVADRPLEIGERVRFRSLQWEVADATERVVTLFGREAANRGRRVRALRGLEPIARMASPSLTYAIGQRGWSDADWRGLHDAFRLTLAHGRGSLGTASWGRLVLEPYQLTPLRRIEELPEPRLLIADDTGLGKTSEAGLIISRLLQRRRADRILVLTRARPEPERWRDEMQEKFGLDFEVVNDGADYARLRRTVAAHLNLYAAVPRLIVSMHFAAQADRVPDLDRPGLRWDVVVIDEAHHVADRGGEKRLTHLGRVVAARCDALLLLTATPHDGKVRSFASLIELLDPYAIADDDNLQPRLVRPLMVRRLKRSVIRADGRAFVEPEIRVVDVEPERLPAERWLERGIRAYASQLRRQQRLFEGEGRRGAAAGCGFLESLLRKRLASSVRACRLTLEQRREGAAAPDEAAEDQPSAAGLEQLALLPNGRTEREVIEDLLARCARVPEGEEGKLRALGRLVEERVAAGEKVVVFTEYRDTLDAIVAMLGRRGIGERERLLTYHGATSDRAGARRRFLEDPDVRVLVATDAASEGINLQLACSHLVHVEVPWNPNRYEQRNGRIDRYGQERQAKILLLVARGYVEQRAAEVVVTKLREIARDLGSVSNVAPIAGAVGLEDYLAANAGGDEEEVDVEGVARDLERRVDAAAGTETGSIPDEVLAGEAFEAAELARVEAELAETAAFAPSFDDVRRFLARYLAHEGGALEPSPDEPGVYRVRVPAALAGAASATEIERATFDRERAVGEANRPRAERVAFLSPGHPVVLAALRRARAWLYSDHFASRVGYRLLPAGAAPGLLFTYAVRFVDRRGETIEERFEVVEARPDGTASRDQDADLRRFLLPPEPGEPGPAEEAALERAAPAAFERLGAMAEAEARRRGRARLEELARQQARVADDALLRLGAWSERAVARLEERYAPSAQLGLLLDAQERRRRTLHQHRMEEVRERERRRRAEIEAMRELRVDSVEAIGALVMVPRGGWAGGA